MKVEFVEEHPDDPDDPDDVVDAGTDRRVPRWVIVALAAAAAVIAVVVIVRRSPDQGTPRAASTGSAPADSSAAEEPVIGGFPSSVRSLSSDLQDVYQAATVPYPATVLRGGSDATSCRPVTVGTSPQALAAAAVTRGLGDYRLKDYSRVIDQNAGLCVLTVRERDAADTTVAVLTVVSPTATSSTPGPGGTASAGTPTSIGTDGTVTSTASRQATRGVVTQGSATVGATRVQYARYRSPDGWVVTLGTVGVDGKQPIFSTLVDVATDPQLRW